MGQSETMLQFALAVIRNEQSTQILHSSVLVGKSEIKAVMNLVSFEASFLVAASPSSCKDPNQIEFTHR